MCVQIRVRNGFGSQKTAMVQTEHFYLHTDVVCVPLDSLCPIFRRCWLLHFPKPNGNISLCGYALVCVFLFVCFCSIFFFGGEILP